MLKKTGQTKLTTINEQLILRALEFGLSLGSLIIIYGLIGLYNQKTTIHYSYQQAINLNTKLNINSLIHGLAINQPTSYLMLGVFIIILTPLLRVGLSIIMFYLAHNSKMLKVTSLVFCILILSMIMGYLTR